LPSEIPLKFTKSPDIFPCLTVVHCQILFITAGDIGEWQSDGSMKIIDRKKNIFKLSQGEYVAVENLENIFGQTPGVDSVQLKTAFIYTLTQVFCS
jgi:acyl-CoA synthetase (AMP-forming)/AMP-acid ligase II